MNRNLMIIVSSMVLTMLLAAGGIIYANRANNEDTMQRIAYFRMLVDDLQQKVELGISGTGLSLAKTNNDIVRSFDALTEANDANYHRCIRRLDALQPQIETLKPQIEELKQIFCELEGKVSNAITVMETSLPSITATAAATHQDTQRRLDAICDAATGSNKDLQQRLDAVCDAVAKNRLDTQHRFDAICDSASENRKDVQQSLVSIQDSAVAIRQEMQQHLAAMEQQMDVLARQIAALTEIVSASSRAESAVSVGSQAVLPTPAATGNPNLMP